MKKIITLAFLTLTAFSYAQVPIVEGTYLPVAGTSVKEAWNMTYNALSVPVTGANVLWNYATQFATTSNVYTVSTTLASAAPYYQYYNMPFSIGSQTYSATHQAYLRTPLNNPSDSLHNFLIINKNGLYNVGGFNKKKAYDSTITYYKPELLVTDTATYGLVKYDTSRYIGYAKKYYYAGNYYKVKLRGYKTKIIEGVGYGTLQLPATTYSNVLLAKATVKQVDSIYVDAFNTGNYTYNTFQTSSYIDYYFVRNNTFGSSYLAYISATSSNTVTNFGWYSQPVDTCTIKGTVFTNALATTNATAGVAYLYRENSNFAKNDILATANLDINGNYQFNSIPYGYYRIAIRPDTTVYHNAFITYHNDSTDWKKVQSFSTFTTSINPTPTYSVGNIHLQYYPTPTGQGNISGTLNLNLLAGFKVAQTNIPGVGSVIKKKPGNSPIIGGVSGSGGTFSYSNLSNGNYEVFVDIPGLNMACTYSFSISGATTIPNLDFTVGNYSINATYTNSPNNACTGSIVTGLTNNSKYVTTDLVSVYPNPYQEQTNIKVTLTNRDNVLLEVYNSLGQKVQTIDNTTKQAGEYIYQFSAKQLQLANGLYFLKLKTNHQQQVLKLIEQ